MAKSRRPRTSNPLPILAYTLTDGGPKPLPESRPHILARMQTEVNAHTFFRQDYSNGEFISSSLCVANTFSNLAKCRTLEAPGYTAHWCEANKLWWRRGGSFD